MITLLIPLVMAPATFQPAPLVIGVRAEPLSAEQRSIYAEVTRPALEKRVQELGGAILKFEEGWVVEFDDPHDLLGSRQRLEVLGEVVKTADISRRVDSSKLSLQSRKRIADVMPEPTSTFQFRYDLGAHLQLTSANRWLWTTWYDVEQNVAQPEPLPLTGKMPSMPPAEDLGKIVFDRASGSVGLSGRTRLQLAYLKDVRARIEEDRLRWRTFADSLSESRWSNVAVGTSTDELSAPVRDSIRSQISHQIGDESDAFLRGAKIVAVEPAFRLFFRYRSNDGALQSFAISFGSRRMRKPL